MERNSFRTYIGIYLISTATLTFEIGLTRLFSMAQGYHFAFMVISIALMGIGAGGAVLMAGKWSERVGTARLLFMLATLFSVVTILSYVTANRILFDPVRAAWEKAEFTKIFVQYIILSLPFVASGMIISATIRSMSRRVHRIYLADMAGAGSGCLLILLVLSTVGGEGAVIVSASLGLLASLLFRIPLTHGERALSLCALSLICLALFGPPSMLETRMSPYRELSAALNFPGGRIVETIHSPSGRLDIIDSPAVRAAPGISLNYTDPLPEQRGFTINGGGLSTVTAGGGDLSFLRHLPSSLAYRLRENADTFVVDAGGGLELLSAMENGASSVTGSERSGVIMRAMREYLADFSGSLYEKRGIREGYGRNILREGGNSFDIIQLPLADTLGSSSSGIRGLQEEYGLTVEAFTDYLSRLRDGGFVSASLYLLPPPRQELKLLSTVIVALEAEGAGAAAERVIAIRSWGVMTLLAGKGTVTAEDIRRTKDFCSEEGFDLVWYPGMKEEEANTYNRFETPLYFRLFRKMFDKGEREHLLRDYIFDLNPPRDDRPFFGHTFKMARVRETYESVGRKWGILIEGGYLLPWILVQAALASAVLIMGPVLFIKGRGVTRGVLLPLSIYFAAIGIGFMFVEIALMQRFIPLLGDPVYAISAVLFSILMSTGIGSFVSGRFRIVERFSVKVILILPIVILVYLGLVTPVSGLLSGEEILVKYLLVFIFLLPLGCAMGIPFPAGMSILGEKEEGLIPWAWCINGSFSVISSVAAMMVALVFGFSTLQLSAALCYAAAWLALARLSAVCKH